MMVKCFLVNHDVVENSHLHFFPGLAPAHFFYSFSFQWQGI
jgi:hypothetical protein